MAEYQVPRILWESLESVLLAQGRIFVKDIARRLEVDEKELLRRVMPSSKIKVYLHDTQTENLQCQAFTHTDLVTHRCRHPVLLGIPFCSQHFKDRLMVIEPAEENIVERIQDTPDRPPLWKKYDNTVIDSKGNTKGHYDEYSGKLTLYEIE